MQRPFEVIVYNLQPIRNREDHKIALSEIERLFDSRQGTSAFDRLDILVTLVEAYEDKHEPILPPEPIEAILYYLESRGLTKNDLESSMGSQDKITAILDRKSPLTLEIIRQLHHQLGIPAQVLIQPYSLAS
jgi:HTH-type transcriptional regulator / antitoxin HigA